MYSFLSSVRFVLFPYLDSSPSPLLSQPPAPTTLSAVGLSLLTWKSYTTLSAAAVLVLIRKRRSDLSDEIDQRVACQSTSRACWCAATLTLALLDATLVSSLLERGASLGAGTLAGSATSTQGLAMVVPADMVLEAVSTWWALSVGRYVVEMAGSLPSVGLHLGLRSMLTRLLAIRSETPAILIPMATWSAALSAVTGVVQAAACAVEAWQAWKGGHTRRTVQQAAADDGPLIHEEDDDERGDDDDDGTVVLVDNDALSVSVQWDESAGSGDGDEDDGDWLPPPLAVRATMAMRSVESGVLALAASRAFFVGSHFPQLHHSWFMLKYGLILGKLRHLNLVGLPFRSSLFTCRAERMFAVFMLSWTALDVWRQLKPRRPRRGQAPQHPTNWLPGGADGTAMSTVASTFSSLTSSSDSIPVASELRAGSPAPGTVGSLRCVICMDEPRCVLLRPCNHLALCLACATEMTRRSEANPGAPQFRECPLCRKQVKSVVKVFV